MRGMALEAMPRPHAAPELLTRKVLETRATLVEIAMAPNLSLSNPISGENYRGAF